jgi:hypothetical protein
VTDIQHVEADEPDPDLLGRSSALVVGLALIGITLTFVWRTYGQVVSPFSPFISAKGPAEDAAAGKPITLKDFQAFQQLIAGPIQSAA